MKKLLTILGSLSLISTSAIAVVACGFSDKNNPIDEYIKLIQQFKKEIHAKFTEYVVTPMHQESTIYDGIVDTKFISKLTLKNTYGNNNDQILFFDDLNSTLQQDFKDDLNLLFNPNNKLKNLKNDIDTTKYLVLINDLENDWIDNVVFDYSSALLEYKEISKDEFIANISINYYVNYFYYDYEGQLVQNRIDQNIIITISNDEQLVDSIQDVYKSFAANLFATNDELVWMDHNILNKYNNGNVFESSDFLTATSSGYRQTLEHYYYNYFGFEILKRIKNDYFLNTNNHNINNAIIEFENNDFINLEKTGNVDNLGKLSAIDYYYQYGFGATEFEWKAMHFWYLYFGEVTKNDKVTLNGKIINGNKELWNNINNSNWLENYETYYSNFYDKYLNIISNATSNVTSQSSAILSTSHEIVTLTGITLSLDSIGYKQKLNDMTFDLSLTPNLTANIVDLKDSNSSIIFSTYYQGVESILNTFHDFYGIKSNYIDLDEFKIETWNSGPPGYWYSDYFKRHATKFYMTGETGYDDFNIWDYWTSLSDDEDFKGINNSQNKLLNALNLESNVQGKRVKNKFLTLLSGTETFNIYYEDITKSSKMIADLQYEEYKNHSSSYLLNDPGLVFRSTSSIDNWKLKLGLKTDLFEVYYMPKKNSNEKYLAFNSYDRQFDDYKTYESRKFTFIGNNR